MIHIYTGDGKGKTTASIGLAIRASKSLKVLFCQVVKNGKSSEISVLENTPGITVIAFGQGKRIDREAENLVERNNVKRALAFLYENYQVYDLIIIDELVTAVSLDLVEEKEILNLLAKISGSREIVMTGRGATKGLVREADLVTEMKKIKHYYDKGVRARKGIES